MKQQALKIIVFLFVMTSLSLTLNLDIIYRDFSADHPDFQNVSVCEKYYVSDLAESFGTSGDFIPSLYEDTACVASHETFRQWFTNILDVNLQVNRNVTLTKDQNNYYVFGGNNFFPLDGLGFMDIGSSGHNNYFTMHISTSFLFKGGENIELISDDDAWVFVNGMLALDNGGIRQYGVKSNLITLNASSFELSIGNTYTIDIYYADRYPPNSFFQFKTNLDLNENPLSKIDTDGDLVLDISDNCINKPNPRQLDCNENGPGDVCDHYQGQLAFPIWIRFSYNFDPLSTQYSGTRTFETISTKQITFIDPIPIGSIHSQFFKISLTFTNPGKENCLFEVSIGNDLATSDPKTFVVLGGNSTIFRTWQGTKNSLGQSWYQYKNPPHGMNESVGTGANRVILKKLSSKCSATLGSVFLRTSLLPITNTSNVIGKKYYSQCLPDTSCKYGTLFFGGYCACWSGAWGRQCSFGEAYYNYLFNQPWSSSTFRINEYIARGLDQAAMESKNLYYDWNNHPTCPPFDWEIVDSLSTTVPPPVIEQAFFADGNLEVIVSQPLTTNGRAETIVMLNTNRFTPEMSDCIYPTSKYIHKRVFDCSDIYHLQIPWNIASKCNWTIVQEETHLVYRGAIFLQTSEYLDFNEWRVISSSLKFKIRFQKYISLGMSGAISKNDKDLNVKLDQLNVDNSGNSATLPMEVRFITSLPWPAKLLYGDIKNIPGIVQSYDLSYCDCDNSSNGNCEQRWKAILNFDRGACSFSGDYQIDFSKSLCSGCNNTVTPIIIQIDSDDKCAEVGEEFGIVPTIGSYTDATYTVTSTSYSIGKRAFFKVSVKVGSKYKVETVMLNGLTIRPLGGVPLLIVKDGHPISFSPSADPTIDLNIKALDFFTALGISFNLSESLANYLVSNDKLSFAIGIEIKVLLSGPKKRFNQQTGLESEKQTLSSTIEISGYNVQPKEEVVFKSIDYTAVNTNVNTNTDDSQSSNISLSQSEVHTTVTTNEGHKNIFRIIFTLLSLFAVLF